MIIKFKTGVNTNGNSYGLIIDTDKKTFNHGCGLIISSDFRVTKTDIREFIDFNLKNDGYTYDAKLF